MDKQQRFFECLECGNRTDRLIMDFRTPPLDTKPCICPDCYESEIELAVDNAENDLAELKEDLQEASRQINESIN